jgi:membrane-associated phospholipid phosphatase
VLGVHYPFDVLVGAPTGIAVGTLVAVAARRLAG